VGSTILSDRRLFDLRGNDSGTGFGRSSFLALKGGFGEKFYIFQWLSSRSRKSDESSSGLLGRNVRSLYIHFGQLVCSMSEKELQVSDMNRDSPDLKTAMLERIRADAPRKVWTPSDFVDLASRDAVDKTLQRLTKAGTLRRIDRGLYDQPGFNKLTQKPNPPDPRPV